MTGYGEGDPTRLVCAYCALLTLDASAPLRVSNWHNGRDYSISGQLHPEGTRVYAPVGAEGIRHVTQMMLSCPYAVVTLPERHVMGSTLPWWAVSTVAGTAVCESHLVLQCDEIVGRRRPPWLTPADRMGPDYQ